jgi:ABC-type glutathione transport system ATPase component
MVSHDLAVVTHMCERLMVMQRGRTVDCNLHTPDRAYAGP